MTILLNDKTTLDIPDDVWRASILLTNWGNSHARFWELNGVCSRAFAEENRIMKRALQEISVLSKCG